ncbi:MAG: hypothetical protein LBT52_00905 [Clostridiales Family XIII bacterium]|nr:hypothetical protein [Clostridiales Family XIII bacterium]
MRVVSRRYLAIICAFAMAFTAVFTIGMATPDISYATDVSVPASYTDVSSLPYTATASIQVIDGSPVYDGDLVFAGQPSKLYGTAYKVGLVADKVYEATSPFTVWDNERTDTLWLIDSEGALLNMSGDSDETETGGWSFSGGFTVPKGGTYYLVVGLCLGSPTYFYLDETPIPYTLSLSVSTNFGVVRGTVQDPSGNAPEYATVRVDTGNDEDYWKYSSSANDDGAYELIVPAAPDVKIYVRTTGNCYKQYYDGVNDDDLAHPKTAVDATPIAVSQGTIVDEINFKLKKSATISGVLRGLSTGYPDPESGYQKGRLCFYPINPATNKVDQWSLGEYLGVYWIGNGTKTTTEAYTVGSLPKGKWVVGLLASGSNLEEVYYMQGAKYTSDINQATRITITGQESVKGIDIDLTPERVTSAPDTSIKGATIAKISNKIFTGNPIKPAVKVTLGNKTVPSSAYTVQYTNNTKIGTAKVTVTSKTGSGYKDSATATFKIVAPTIAKVSGVKIKSAKKAFTLTWKKNSKVTGYEVKYTTDKKFKKSIKTKTISKNATVKFAAKKLKGKTTYYVKARAFKKVAGQKFYSANSKAFKVKTK